MTNPPDQRTLRSSVRSSLRILATSDIHMQLTGYDYHQGCPVMGIGFYELAPAIKQARAEAPNCLLVDNGDLIQGNPIAETIMADRKKDPNQKHPIIALMNALKYDVAGAGNHDFDFGIDAYESVLAEANFPFLCANLVKQLGPNTAQDTPLLQRWVLLQRTLIMEDASHQDINIGIISVLPKETAQWGYGTLNGLAQTRPLLQTVKELVPVVRKAGADVVLVLSHSGVNGLENSDDGVSLKVTQVPGVDAVVAGHVHAVYPEPGIDKADESRAVCTMPGSHASHLGVMDLALRFENDRWRVESSKGFLRTHINGAQPPKELPSRIPLSFAKQQKTIVPATVQDAHNRTIKRLNQTVGQTKSHLESFFELVLPTTASNLVAQSIQHEISKLRSASIISPDLPVVTSLASFRSGGVAGPGNFVNIAPGPISVRNIGEIYPFPNKLVLAKVTVGFVKAWMRHASRVFGPLQSHSRAQLFDANAPKYDSELFYGINYVTQIDRPISSRKRVELKGPYWGAVDDDQPLILATNNYRAIGSGGYPAIPTDNVVYSDDATIPDLVRRYLTDFVPVDVALSSPAQLRIAARAGTSVSFPTGTDAAKHIPHNLAHMLKPLSPDRAGFLSVELRF